MKKERWYYIVIIVILIAIIFWMRSCSGSCPEIQSSTTTTDTTHGSSITYKPVPIKDTFVRLMPVYVPQPYAIHDTLHDQIPTASINGDKSDYDIFSDLNDPSNPTTRKYSDTLRFDSSGYAVVNDLVEGTILKRQFNYSIFKTTVTNNIVQKKKLKLYLGLEYTYPINYAGAAAIVQLKNDNMLKVGYGFANQQSQYSIGYYVKIKLK